MTCAEFQHGRRGTGRADRRGGQGLLLGKQIEHVHWNSAGHYANKMQATLAAQGSEHGRPVEVGVGGDQEKVQGAGDGVLEDALVGKPRGRR